MDSTISNLDPNIKSESNSKNNSKALNEMSPGESKIPKSEANNLEDQTIENASNSGLNKRKIAKVEEFRCESCDSTEKSKLLRCYICKNQKCKTCAEKEAQFSSKKRDQSSYICLNCFHDQKPKIRKKNMINEFGFDISQFYPGLIDSVVIKRRKRHREETPVENQNQNQKETLDLDQIHQCVSPPSELNNTEGVSQPVRESLNLRKKTKFRRRNQILNNLNMDKICHQCGKVNNKLEYFECQNKLCGKFYCNRCMKKYEESRRGNPFGDCFSCKKICKCLNCKSIKNIPNKNIVSIDLENLDQKKNLVQIDDYLIVENEAPEDEAELYSQIEEISEIEDEKIEASFESPKIKIEEVIPKIESPQMEKEIEEDEDSNLIVNSVENLKNIKLLPCIVCSQVLQDNNTIKTLTFKSLKMFVSYLLYYFDRNPPSVYPDYHKAFTEFDEYYRNFFVKYYKSDYVFKSVKTICMPCFENQLKEERGFDNLFNYLHISNNVLNAGKKEKKEKFKPFISEKKVNVAENLKSENINSNINTSNMNPMNSTNNNSAGRNLPNTPNLSKLLEFLRNSNITKNNEKSNINLLNLLSQVNQVNSNSTTNNLVNNTCNLPSGNHSEVKSEVIPQEEESLPANHIQGNIQTTFHQQTINQPINQSFNLNINNAENESRHNNLNTYMNNVLEELRKQFFCIQYYSLIQKFFISYIFRHLDTFIEQITRNQSLGEFVMNSMVSHLPKILGCFENNTSEVQNIINSLNEQMSLLKNINSYGVNLTLSLNSNFEGLKNNGMKIFKAMDPSLNACLNNNLNSLMMSAKEADNEKNSFEAIMNSLGGINKDLSSNLFSSIANSNNQPNTSTNNQEVPPISEQQTSTVNNNNMSNTNKFSGEVSSHNMINNSGGLLNILASMNKSGVPKQLNSIPQGLNGLFSQALNLQGLENLMPGSGGLGSSSNIANALNGHNFGNLSSLSALSNLGAFNGMNPLSALSGLSGLPSLNSMSGFSPFNNMGLGGMGPLSAMSGMQALSALNGMNSLPGMSMNAASGLSGLSFLNSLNNLSNSNIPPQQNLLGNMPGSSLPSLENMLQSILNAENHNLQKAESSHGNIPVQPVAEINHTVNPIFKVEPKIESVNNEANSVIQKPAENNNDIVVEDVQNNII